MREPGFASVAAPPQSTADFGARSQLRIMAGGLAALQLGSAWRQGLSWEVVVGAERLGRSCKSSVGL